MRVVVAVIGLALAWIGIRGFANRTDLLRPRTAPIVRTASEAEAFKTELEARDLGVLKGERSGEQDRYAALVRVAQRQDLVARDTALKWAKDPSPLVRQGVAGALGYFDDDVSLGQLKALARDPEWHVRQKTVEALGFRTGLQRISLLEELQSQTRNDPRLEILRLQSLYRAAWGADAESIRRRSLEALLREGQGGIEAVVSLAPRAPEVASILHSRAKGEAGIPAAVQAIRLLAATGDSWLVAALADLWRQPHGEIRVALLRALTAGCSPERWRLIRDGLRNKEGEVQVAALEALALSPSKAGVVLLNEVGEGRNLTNEARRLLPEIRRALESPSAQDPCGKAGDR